MLNIVTWTNDLYKWLTVPGKRFNMCYSVKIVKIKPSYYSEDFYSFYEPSGVLSYSDVHETKDKALIHLKEKNI